MAEKLLTLLFLMLAVSVSRVSPQQRVEHDFCWKDTYIRGIGTIPTKCESGEDRIGLLCYPQCPSGMYRWGFDCHSYCPEGWKDQGLFCRLAEYGRGAGYPWKFGDPLNDSGMFQRCEKANGKDNCEKWGLVVYPKCKAGFHNFACCICRPQVPKCSDYNLNAGIDLSCAKRIVIGLPRLGICNATTEDRNGGLCYKKCDTAYKGIGPVCWGKNPIGWVGCGMGSAKTDKICRDTIFNQVFSVGQLALNIVTMGESSPALEELKQSFKKLTQLYNTFSEVADLITEALKNPAYSNIAEEANKITTQDLQNLTAADMIRIAANIAALLDPTGIASVITAYSYPKCSAITSGYSGQDLIQIQEKNKIVNQSLWAIEYSQKDYAEQNRTSSQYGHPEWPFEEEVFRQEEDL